MTDHAYVAYLDILGYRELLDIDVREGSNIFRDRMIRAFRCFDSVNQSKYQYKAISDSIFICCTERELAQEVLETLRTVFIAFLHEGLLIRGGLSFGQHFQNQTITYSPVLTKAYALESQVAQFPRIMIDTNIIEMFGSLKDSGLVLKSGENWFLDVVTSDNFKTTWDAANNTHRDNIESIKRNESVRIKHRWFQDYLSEAARLKGLCPAPDGTSELTR